MLDPFGTAAGRLRVPASGPPREEHPGWPDSTPSISLAPSRVLPEGGVLRLRPLMRGDGRDWRRQRVIDEQYLRPVEPTIPTTWENAHSGNSWWNHLMFLRDNARMGSIIPLVIELDGQFMGQVTLGNIQHGSIGECGLATGSIPQSTAPALLRQRAHWALTTPSAA